MRHAFYNQSHFAFKNVNDLLLWVRVHRHPTPSGECCEHLIHGFAVCDRPARDAGTNFNRRILLSHGQNLMREGELRECSFCSCDICPRSTRIVLSRRHACQYSTIELSSLDTCCLQVIAGRWHNGRHENFYVINHNSVCSIDRCSFVCANSRHVTGYRHCPGWRCDCPNWSA